MDTHNRHAEEFTIDDERKDKKATRIHGIGIVCALISAIVYSIMIILVKLVDLHPVQINLSRCAVQFLTILPFLQYKRDKIDITGPVNLKILLWIRGLLGSTGMMFLYLAVDRLPAGNALTLSYIRIVLVPFIARVLLHESLSVFDIIFALIALVGVVLIARPTFLFPVSDLNMEGDVIGTVFALLSAVCVALSTIAIRKLGKETHPGLHILYYSFMGSITTMIILSATGEFSYPCWKDIPFVLSFGILGNLGQFLVTISLHNERVGTVVVLRSIQIVFVYIMQVTILGNVPSSLSLTGAALIFLTSVGIGVRKAIHGRNQSLKTQ